MSFEKDAREAAKAHVNKFGFIENPQMEADFTDGAEWGYCRAVEELQSLDGKSTVAWADSYGWAQWLLQRAGIKK